MGLDSASNLHGVLQIGPYLQRELGYLQTWYVRLGWILYRLSVRDLSQTLVLC
jgi:hypothetical protein